MSEKCHVRRASSLTHAANRAENQACRGSIPTHSAPAPQAHAPGDLAGVPVARYVVPAPPPRCGIPKSPTSALLRRAHRSTLWRLAMAKASTNGKAARHPARDARAPRPGAAQPPLDLSLGHIGTTVESTDPDIEVEDMGPFRVVFDHTTMTGQVFTYESAFANRAERRAAEKSFRRAIGRSSAQTGFGLAKGGPL